MKNAELDKTDIIRGTPKESKNEILNTIIVSGIYIILNKINNKWYVGSSRNIIGERWVSHRTQLNCNRHNNKHLSKSWNKYGSENFEFHIVELVDESNLLLVEQKYLDWAKLHRNQCYNVSFNALSPSKGMKFGRPSEETIQKISNAHKGKKLSIEHRNKISEGLRGKSPSIETREKLQQKSTGRKHTEEMKKYLSEMRKGKSPWNKGKTNCYKPEVLDKMRQAGYKRKGIPKTLEHRKKISEAHLRRSKIRAELLLSA